MLLAQLIGSHLRTLIPGTACDLDTRVHRSLVLEIDSSMHSAASALRPPFHVLHDKRRDQCDSYLPSPPAWLVLQWRRD